MSTSEDVIRQIKGLSTGDVHILIQELNKIKVALHEISPFASEPVDCVLWVPSHSVEANDYNPNSVAPPEMKLLAHSIGEDGYTQPIVAWSNDEKYTVIDGFHRHRVGKENEDIRTRVHGYLPLSIINEGRSGRSDRIASTIRHNRARGKHKVEAMSDIVIELKRRNWSDEKISRELGMDSDEVLRLCQITGLADVFKSHEFSKSWEVGTQEDFSGIDEETIDPIGEPESNRILHTFDKWECHKSNFYGTTPPPGMTNESCELAYKSLLSNKPEFESALHGVITEWKHSCEHYLTNEKMNRIAWLGQASLSYRHKIPSCYRGGYNLLSQSEKDTANDLALKYLNLWLVANGRESVTIDGAMSKVDAELY